MKTFILAIDGLEHDLVEEWRLPNLLQTTHGKIVHKPEYCTFQNELGYVPYTPLIWTSFITGIPPKDHDVKGLWTYGKTLDYFRKFKLLRKLKFFTSRLGVKRRIPGKEDVKGDTLFDLIQPSIGIDVIGYNPITELREDLTSAFKKKGIMPFLKTARINFVKRKKLMWKRLGDDWRLFMMYYKLLDSLGHIQGLHKKAQLHHHYLSFDMIAHSVKEVLDDNVLFLVISDHGIKSLPDGTGTHSDHSFYSLNKATDWQPSEITDFFPKIVEWCLDGKT